MGRCGVIKDIFRRILWEAEEVMFPRRCIFCGELIRERKEILACDCCERGQVLGKDERCFEVIGDNASYVAAPFLYEGDVRSAIISFKFYSKDFYGKTFAHFMKDTLDEVCRFEDIDLIVPVPLHQRKLKERGYNQAAVLAEELKAYGAEYDENALKKIKDSGKQSRKNAVERAEAVKGSYICTRDVTGKNVLLVDDISTTGVTLNYCAGELKKRGAKRVVCITAAKRYVERDTETEEL